MSEASTSPRSQRAVAWYQTLFSHLDLDISVEGKDHGDMVEIRVDGKDADAFLRFDDGGAAVASTVLAEQTLRDRRRFPRIRVGNKWIERKVVNTEGIARLAGRLGTFVEKTGKTVAVLGMDSQGRKALHHGLADAKVTTESQGYGAFRHLRVQTETPSS